MKLLPPFGKSNPEIREGLRKYSASKYGRPRAIVEDEIRKRLSVKSVSAQQSLSQPHMKSQQKTQMSWQERAFSNQNNDESFSNSTNNSQSSFLDGWLKKRDEIRNNPPKLTSIPIQNQVSITNQNISQKESLAQTFQKNIMQSQKSSSYNIGGNNPQVQQNIRNDQIQRNAVIQDINIANIQNKTSVPQAQIEDNSQLNLKKSEKTESDEIIFKIR